MSEPSQPFYLHTSEERAARGILTLPGSRNAAIQAAENSDLLREALGDHVYASLLSKKKIEWDDYRRRPPSQPAVSKNSRTRRHLTEARS